MPRRGFVCRGGALRYRHGGFVVLRGPGPGGWCYEWVMRLFVAVAVPVPAADELDDAVAPLRRSWPALRWTGRDAWHVTLAFLGEVNDTVSARLMPRLERAAARHPCLPVSLDGAGRLPGRGPRPGAVDRGAGRAARPGRPGRLGGGRGADARAPPRRRSAGASSRI